MRRRKSGITRMIMSIIIRGYSDAELSELTSLVVVVFSLVAHR